MKYTDPESEVVFKCDNYALRKGVLMAYGCKCRLEYTLIKIEDAVVMRKPTWKIKACKKHAKI